MQSSMSVLTVLGLCCFSFMMAGGQILFKETASRAPSMTSLQSVLGLLTLPSFWAAGILYAFATLLWIKMLQTVPLSRAYPFAALGFIIVPLVAMLFFKEPISLRYMIGAAFIMIGIYITAGA